MDMVATVKVNQLTVVHRTSQGQAVSGPPDVCLTPAPGGPVPVPSPGHPPSSNPTSPALQMRKSTYCAKSSAGVTRGIPARISSRRFRSIHIRP